MVDLQVGGAHCSFARGDQGDPICFRVRFDAKVVEHTTKFHGIKAFQCPSELAVPLKLQLHNATLRDLWLDFMSRVTSLHPQLTQSCAVDAFYVHADSTMLSRSESTTEDEPFLRLDIEANSHDTLDCFFAPRDLFGGDIAPRPVAYDIIAHWRPKSADASNGDSPRFPPLPPLPFLPSLPSLHDRAGRSGAASSSPAPPAPVVFPSARRDVYATLPPFECTAAVLRAAPPAGPPAARAAQSSAATDRRRALRAARRALQSREAAARRAVADDECAARADVDDAARGDRRQIEWLRRLADDECAAPACEWRERRRVRGDDTQPLVEVPTALPRAELAVRAEMTAWLAILFAAKGGKARGGPALGQEEAEDLLSYYSEVRCDILAWERREFRELTSIMKKIIKKEHALVEQSIYHAFRDEVAHTDVLKFDCYKVHYARAPALLCGSPTSEFPSDSVAESPSHENPNEDCQQQQNTVEGEVAESMDTAEVVPLSCSPERPQDNLPRLSMPDDESFRRFLAETKIRAVAALEEIRAIDLRHRDPVVLRIARHRLGKGEQESRKAILLQEANELQDIFDNLQRTLLEDESKALRAYMKLISPVLESEEHEREEIVEMEDRRISLYASLHLRGAQRINSLSPPKDASHTHAGNEVLQDFPLCR